MSVLVTRAPGLWPLVRGPTRRFWERSAAGWDDRTGAERAERDAPLLAACERVEGEPERILELGTGTGAGALALARRYPEAEIVGVDLASAMVEAAEAKVPAEPRGRVRFRVADAAALPFGGTPGQWSSPARRRWMIASMRRRASARPATA
jgi:trans-aconitate 2-methyltransferase